MKGNFAKNLLQNQAHRSLTINPEMDLKTNYAVFSYDTAGLDQEARRFLSPFDLTLNAKWEECCFWDLDPKKW